MRLAILCGLLIAGMLAVAFTVPDDVERKGLRDAPAAESTETPSQAEEQAAPTQDPASEPEREDPSNTAPAE